MYPGQTDPLYLFMKMDLNFVFNGKTGKFVTFG